MGSAIYSQDFKLKQTLHPITSIKTAELYSILLSLREIKKSYENQKYIIFTDSLTTVEEINRISRSEINNCIHEIHYNITKSGGKIVIAWIPAHKEIFGNEIADLEAKIAATNINQIYPTETIKFEDFWENINHKLNLQWNSLWRRYKSSNIHQSTSTFFSSIINKKIGRREQTILSRIRSGHSNLTHLYLLQQSSPPTCELCNTRLDLDHIFKICPRYNHQRQSSGFKYEAILHSSEDQDKIINFCKSINIFNEI